MKLPPLTIIPAGAGSGKTYSIQTKLTEWVRKGVIKPERIIAVTFTEAAAAELRERIRSALLSESKVGMEEVLALDQAYITTIHGFGLRLLQEYCFEGGWSPVPRLLSEDEGDILIRQALAITRKADAIMADLARFGYHWHFNNGTAEDQFRSRLSRMIQKHRILGINGIERRIKTHLLRTIKRIYGRTDNANLLEQRLIVAVKALLRKFAGSQAGLYPSNNAFVKAMTSNYRNLQKAAKKGALNGDWPLWVALQDLRTSKGGSALPDGYDDLAKEVMAAASELYRHPGPLDDAAIHAEAMVDAAQDCLQQHTILKRDKRLVDYGDMLSLAHELLLKHSDVLLDLSKKVDCVIIDEFQDTNPLQFSLLWSLYRQGIPTLVVGDVKQAIMGFQDADSRLLEELEKSASANCSPLQENWRTVKPLMKFLNAAGKGLFAGAYHTLTPKVTAVSKNTPLHFINFTKYSKNAFYGDHVAAHIKSILNNKQQILDNGEYRTVLGSDIAILLPNHSHISTYAESFRQAGLQVQVDESGWFESRCVQILYYALLFVADQDDRHAALYLTVTELGSSTLQSAIKNLINDKPLQDPLIEALAALGKKAGHDDVYALVQQVIAVMDLFQIVAVWPNADHERANILRLLAEAEEFTITKPEALEASGLYGFGIKTFLAWLVRRVEGDNSMPRAKVIEQNAVQFTTWHSAKGREWPIVAVCGTFKEYYAKLPSLDIQYHSFADFNKILQNAVIEFSPSFAAQESRERFLLPLQQEAEKNARRLLYVVMTRAKEQLIIERAGHQEGKGKQSFWNLLGESTKMNITDSTVSIGAAKTPCSQTVIEKEDAVIGSSAQKQMVNLSRLGIRAIKKRQLVDTTPATASPSMMVGEKPKKKGKLTTDSYGIPFDIDLHLDPAEMGTVMHRCFEVLTAAEDRTNLLEAATGYAFNQKQKKQLQAAVVAFEEWCTKTFGKVVLHKEIPITYQNEDGVLVSGIIDLLIEGKSGCWIIDHKTHRPKKAEKDFWEYWPQLQAYRLGVESSGTRKIIGVGVHWVGRGRVSVLGD